MPIQNHVPFRVKEIKVRTLKKLHAAETDSMQDTPYPFEKLEKHLLFNNILPWKIGQRGIISTEDVIEVINKMEQDDLISIHDNKIRLTKKGKQVAIRIKDIALKDISLDSQTGDVSISKASHAVTQELPEENDKTAPEHEEEPSLFDSLYNRLMEEVKIEDILPPIIEKQKNQRDLEAITIKEAEKAGQISQRHLEPSGEISKKRIQEVPIQPEPICEDRTKKQEPRRERTAIRTPKMERKIIRCPHCNNPVRKDATRCPFCHGLLKSTEKQFCPKCNLKLRIGAKFCPRCGIRIK
ncbi:MAG: zinc ribbon domain-containing protein [Candidatus Helarchaeota archaeon]